MVGKFTNLDNFTKHPFYLCGDKVAEICAPLFCNFPINYFCYTKWYQNGGLFLSSDKIWLLHYLQSNYHFLITGKKIHSWATDMDKKALTTAEKQFNYHNGIIIEKPHRDYIETLEFASPNQYSDPLEFCYNKDHLNNFILYFKDKTSALLETLEKNLIFFPPNRFLHLKNRGKPKVANSQMDLYSTTQHKKTSINFQGKKVLLSRREFEVLDLLAKGKNMAQIANILKISRRTVESYLYDAKSKTGAYTVNQLLESFIDTLF